MTAESWLRTVVKATSAKISSEILLLMQDFLSWKILNSLYYNINHSADGKLRLKASLQVPI